MKNASSSHFNDTSIISAKVNYSVFFLEVFHILSFTIFFDFKCKKVKKLNSNVNSFFS